MVNLQMVLGVWPVGLDGPQVLVQVLRVAEQAEVDVLGRACPVEPELERETPFEHGGIWEDVVEAGEEPLHHHQDAAAVECTSLLWPNLLLEPGLDGRPEAGGGLAHAHENLRDSRLRSARTSRSWGTASKRQANSRSIVRDGRYWATRRCAPTSFPISAATVGQSAGGCLLHVPRIGRE